jgi:hypothetical protein
MQMSRVFLRGGAIGVTAALVFLLSGGLLAAAAFMIAVFAGLITVGLLIGLALDTSPLPAIGRTIRSIRSSVSGHLAAELCNTCRRPTVTVRSMRVCPACDLIAVAN